MRVSDIMTREVITASETDSVVDVARIISESRIHAVPIVDARGILRGIIAESDFFTKSSSGEIHLPSYIELLRKLKFPEAVNNNEDSEKVRSMLLAKAGDVMSRECVTIAPETHVQSLLELIRTTGYSSIPVTDEEKKLLGIVTIQDAIHAIVPGKEMTNVLHLSGRNIDNETEKGSSWIGERFRIVKTFHVNDFVAFLIVAFFAGAAASIIWQRAYEMILERAGM